MTDGFDATVTSDRQGWGVDGRQQQSGSADPRPRGRATGRGPAACSQPDTMGGNRRMLRA
jgi:hypothetical protein